MPITKQILSKFKNPNFVETGTLHGEAVRHALELGFSKIVTIEIDPRLHKASEAKFGRDKRVTCLCGDSGALLQNVLRSPMPGSVTFWLDAHPPGDLSLDNPANPTLRELHSIMERPSVAGDVILIDDMRLFPADDHQALEALLVSKWPNGVAERCDSPVAANDIFVFRPM